MSAQKYENQTQHLFASSEGGFETIGDQNHFRINLNSMPFRNADNTILRMSLKQFNMPKNFYNVNSTNNKLRMFCSTFVSGGITVPDIDAIFEVTPGDYLTYQSLVLSFATAFRNKLVTLVSGFTNSNLTIQEMVSTFTKHSNDGTGRNDEPEEASKRNDYRLAFSLTCTASGFAWTNPVNIACLNIPTSTPLVLNIASGSTLERDEFFSDSYILFGGVRVEEFEGTTANPVWDISKPQISFSSKAKVGTTNILGIASYFPMNTSLNTNEYLYISSKQTYSQSSSSLENVSNEHSHEFITSNILAKAMRCTNPVDGSVFFKIIEPSPYFANITASFLNQIEIEVRDHRGRELSYPDTTNSPISMDNSMYSAPSSTLKQNKFGNTSCDLVIVMEKYSNANGVDALQGIPPPLQIPNNSFSTNLSINQKCR